MNLSFKQFGALSDDDRRRLADKHLSGETAYDVLFMRSPDETVTITRTSITRRLQPTAQDSVNRPLNELRRVRSAEELSARRKQVSTLLRQVRQEIEGDPGASALESFVTRVNEIVEYLESLGDVA